MPSPLLRFLINLTIGLSIAAALIGLARYRRLPPSLRWLAALACFDTVMELSFSTLADVLHIKNLFLVPIVMVGEVLLLSLAYRLALQSATFNRALPWLLGLFIGYAVLNSPLQLGVMRYAVSLSILNDLVQLSLAGLYFQKLLNELRVERLRRDPFFWLSVALAVHGLGDLLISLSSNYMLAHYSQELQKIVLWGVRNVFNIILYAAYCLVLWMRPQRPELRSTQAPASG